ncbi:hypothetical protein NDU88_000381 [Pleurodeles waltl]|uniref:Uncharacterized protein n=1 Tax=Pleurodeles waltl TaxID=8319 RepID=A0AAV7USX7_PLEWA|nr:hypothetical protein NDU88_000381 [Pleurodeles waltl]
MTPDIRIPGWVKGEKGLRRGEDEQENAEKLEETADGGEGKPERRAGNRDVPREGADPVEEQRLEETRRNRHVPGGAWLSKVRSFFKGRLIEQQKSWDRGEEGRDEKTWESEKLEWAGAEEEHMRRKRTNNKAQDVLMAWAQVVLMA